MKGRTGTNPADAVRDLPLLRVRLDETALLCHSIAERAIGFQDPDKYGLMLLAFSSRLLGHAGSLLDLGDSRDTCLIARSMAEGLAQILYAAQDPDARGRRWWQYSAVSRLRFAECALELGFAEPDEDSLREPRGQVREVGDQFLTKAACKAKCGGGKDLPDNPYISSWYGMTIDQLFERVEGRSLYDGIYRPFSGWHHFDSFYVGTAIRAGVGQELAYRHHDPNIAAKSTAVAIQVLLQTHILLDEHFELGAREKLEAASNNYTAWHEELHSSLKP